MKLSSEVTRRNRQFAPASSTAAASASDTLPERRHSSTTSNFPISRACATTSSTGSGAIQRKSRTRAATPCSRSRRAAARRLIHTPLPYVAMTRSADFSR
jgi:hypothetical protein